MAPQQRGENEEATAEAASVLREPLLPSSTDDFLLQDSSSSSFATRPIISRNVPLTLIHTVFYFAGSSIWSYSVLAAYVYILEEDNPEMVGYISGVMGLSQVLCSFPAGRFADSHRRDTLLRIASVVGMVAICATLFALYKEDYRYLVVALAVWGCTRGIGNTALWALYADSVPTGDRSHYFTKRAILITLGTVAGPVTSLVMFHFLGNIWNVRECAIVLAVGQAVSLPAIILFCFFNDDYIVHEEDEQEALVSQQTLVEQEQSISDEEVAQQDEPLLSEESDSDDDDDSNDATSGWWWCGGSCCRFLQKRRIPCLVATADLAGGLAAGMSIRYFPIFFVDALRLGPVAVQLIYVVAPLLQATMAQIGQRFSIRFGRLHVAVVHKWTGALLMYAMIMAYRSKYPLWFVILLYVCRTAIINSVGALTKSTLMDHVPKSERGQWSALESVNVFGWSGSAVFGGLLVGRIGLLHLFTITASLQILATFPLIALFRDDKLEQSTITNDTSRARIQQEDNDEVESAARRRRQNDQHSVETIEEGSTIRQSTSSSRT